MTDAPTHHAQCFCGAVQIETVGAPLQQGFCHCDTCKQRSGAPMIGYTLWPAAAVTIARGEDMLQRAQQPNRPDHSQWMSCRACGCAVGTDLHSKGLIDILVGTFRDFTFEPKAHLNYGEAIIRMADGLPKYRDMPARAGGSDEMMPE